MTNMNNKVVFFDIGGVLVNVDSKNIIAKVAQLLNVSEQGIVDIMTPKLIHEYETGQISTDSFYRRLLKCCDNTNKMSLLEFKKHWEDIFTPKVKMINLLKEISKRNDVWLLSNTNDFHYDLLKEQFDFMDYISGAIYSFHVGFMKPDPIIYHIALTESHTKADDAIFIDDLMPNIMAAQKEGFDAIHYTSDTQAQLELSLRLTYLEKLT